VSAKRGVLARTASAFAWFVVPSIREFRLAWRVGRDGYRYMKRTGTTPVAEDAAPALDTLLVSDPYLAYVRRRTRTLARFTGLLAIADVLWWLWMVAGAGHGLFSPQSVGCVATLVVLVSQWLRQAFTNWQARHGGVARFGDFLSSGGDLWPR
jgi:hypothetical protein